MITKIDQLKQSKRMLHDRVREQTETLLKDFATVERRKHLEGQPLDDWNDPSMVLIYTLLGFALFGFWALVYWLL